MAVRILVLASISVLVLGGLFFILRPDPPEASPGKRSFDLEIQEYGMSPGEVAVRKGDRVTLNVSAGQPAEIHVHGYDIEAEIAPDEPTEFSFQADLTGRFPIEDHETGTELGVFVVEPR